MVDVPSRLMRDWPLTNLPHRDHMWVVTREGLTVGLSAGQVLGLLQASDIPADSINTARLQDGAVDDDKLASDSVITSKILNEAVTNAKLAAMAEALVKGREVGSGAGVPVDLTAAQLQAILNTAMYESSPQTITNGGGITLAHGLGGVPSRVMGFLVAQTAVSGVAAAGDVFPAPSSNLDVDQAGTARTYGTQLRADASQIIVQFGAGGLVLMTAGAGVATALVNANWRLVVRAWL